MTEFKSAYFLSPKGNFVVSFDMASSNCVLGYGLDDWESCSGPWNLPARNYWWSWNEVSALWWSKVSLELEYSNLESEEPEVSSVIQPLTECPLA
ncbi:hypothetical protein AK812_SmicGene23303 [Symbiodinium microadriaticum]|uniref:Uncharacterized protein n=1 Tax=Symbiodinium microadriaticum TaxID=2951 RepID=A0A1Q9DHM8_SYMMI|nr:hypothetical protein AK812_SmicGene23303 [Symbiodinium microadriaticum]